MKSDLNISLIQTALEWENPKLNREKFSAIISSTGQTDLIILPEMFTTGFSMDSEKNAEEMNGPTHRWLLKQSASIEAAITGSLIIKEGSAYYNRMLFVLPDGTTHYYDKRHLFRMADETDYFKPGEQRVIVNFNGWKIFLQVCYDLRFPVFSRNRYSNGSWEYDLIIYAANWPVPRINAWDDLLKARAHENQAYVAGVNRVGEDETGKSYNGHSAIYSPKGEVMVSFNDGQDDVKTVSISLKELNELRKKFPIGLDADSFHLD